MWCNDARRRSDVSEVVEHCVFACTRQAKREWWLIEDFVLIGWRLEQNEKANTDRRKREEHTRFPRTKGS